MVSPYQGAVQRLPDGNTVITDGFRTVVFCVSPDGEVLWEVYVKGKNTIPRTKIVEDTKAMIAYRGQPGFRLHKAWAYPVVQ